MSKHHQVRITEGNLMQKILIFTGMMLRNALKRNNVEALKSMPERMGHFLSVAKLCKMHSATSKDVHKVLFSDSEIARKSYEYRRNTCRLSFRKKSYLALLFLPLMRKVTECDFDHLGSFLNIPEQSENLTQLFPHIPRTLTHQS